MIKDYNTNLNNLIGELIQFIHHDYKPAIGIIIGIKYNDTQEHFMSFTFHSSFEVVSETSIKVHWIANALPDYYNNNKPNEPQYTLIESNNKNITYL